MREGFTAGLFHGGVVPKMAGPCQTLPELFMFAVARFKVVGGFAVLAAMLLVTGCANTITVTQQEIQQQIDSRLPVGTPPGMPIAASLNSLQCDLLGPGEAAASNLVNGGGSGNNVALQAQVHFSLLGLIQMNSTAGLQGRLAYNADRGAFYIQQPTLTTFDLGGVAPQQQQQIKASLQQLLTSVLAVTPVYTLQDSRARQHISQVEVQDRVMLVHLKP
jgi:hypothetical protein